MRPLTGVRVLDFSTLLPGPMATLLLAEAGAEVIKIERPDGEDMRRYEPRWGRDSVNFALLNRGKKSVAADLKQPQARDRILELARGADVVVEQFRPGVMARLGLGFETLRRVNPKLIYCSISGYGQSGPRRDRAGHDLNYIGDAGLLALSCGPPGQRTLPPALLADIAGGAYPAVMNILLALRRRDATGEGAHLDIAMTEGAFTFAYWALGSGLAGGDWPGNATGLVTGASPRYRIYDTKDGRMVAAAPIEQKFWDAFVRAIGLDETDADDARDPAATAKRVADIIRSRTAADWAPIFDEADCCCSIVQDLREALAHPHFKARMLFGYKLTNSAGEVIPALPVPIESEFRSAASESAGAPRLGEHNAEFGF